MRGRAWMGEGPRRRGVRGMVEKGGGRGRGEVVVDGLLVEGVIVIVVDSVEYSDDCLVVR
jgi:hypothetical protein